MERITASKTAVSKAYNFGGVRVMLPWPTDRLGKYGSGAFDGSPVSPSASDAAMDLYVQEALDTSGLRVAGICAGRVGNQRPIPVICVTLEPDPGASRFHRSDVEQSIKFDEAVAAQDRARRAAQHANFIAQQEAIAVESRMVEMEAEEGEWPY